MNFPESTICYFGDFDINYSRNRVMIKGLKDNGINIVLCNSTESGIKKYLRLLKIHKNLKGRYKYLIVGYSETRMMVFFAKFFFGKFLIWDAFYSLYDARVNDRKKVSLKSIKAKLYWGSDWIACYFSDRILLDTNEQIKYFVKEFQIDQKKFVKIFAGTDESVFFPKRTNINKEKFIVHFHGNYIPLQGTKIIINAAKLLENDKEIVFRMVGSQGQTYLSTVKLKEDLRLNNVQFFKSVPYEELPKIISEADLCLGIFGSSEKAGRVIPNKIYEAIAMQKPVITRDSPTISEIFTDKENILLCQPADPKSLADKISEIKDNVVLRNKIAVGGYEIFKKYCTPKIVTADLAERIISNFN